MTLTLQQNLSDFTDKNKKSLIVLEVLRMNQTTKQIMAEEQGFEPWRPVKSLRAFQARPFSHLGIPPTRF